jgi:hypothetical protein
MKTTAKVLVALCILALAGSSATGAARLLEQAEIETEVAKISGYRIWADAAYPSLNFRGHTPNWYGELLVMRNGTTSTNNTCSEVTLAGWDEYLGRPADRTAATLRLDGCAGGPSKVVLRSLGAGGAAPPDICFDAMNGSETVCINHTNGQLQTTAPIAANGDLWLPGGWKLGEFSLNDALECKGPDDNIWCRFYENGANDYAWFGLAGTPKFWILPDTVKADVPLELTSASEVTCPAAFSGISPDKCFKIKAADGNYYAIPGKQI